MLIANASNYNPYQNNKPQGIIMENKGLLRQNLLNSIGDKTFDSLPTSNLITNSFYTVQDWKRVDSIDLETQ